MTGSLSCFTSVSYTHLPEELATVTTAAAIGLAQGRSTEEIGILAAVFTQIGDVLATIAVQRAAIEACCEKKCSRSSDNH